jgi:uncharacterized protein (DUF952 family)
MAVVPSQRPAALSSLLASGVRARDDHNTTIAVKQNDPEPQLIYHIAEPELWKTSAEAGTYAAPSLKSEGFIHCSFAHQVQRSLDKFFADADSVIVLEIDPLMLQSELRFEPADDDTFPHIYGELNADAVVMAELLMRDEKGELAFPRR